MERLLYSGLMLAAGMLSVWTALLVTATFIALAPGLRKSAPSAATISSSKGRVQRPRGATRFASTQNGAEEFTSARSVPETIS